MKTGGLKEPRGFPTGCSCPQSSCACWCSRDYQLNRVPICIVLELDGSPPCQFASVVLPTPTVGVQFTRFSTLKTSRLNSYVTFEPIGIRFRRLKSKLTCIGPVTTSWRTPQSP